MMAAHDGSPPDDRRVRGVPAATQSALPGLPPRVRPRGPVLRRGAVGPGCPRQSRRSHSRSPPPAAGARRRAGPPAGRPRRHRGGPPRPRAGRRPRHRRGHRTAGGALRRPALRPVQGPRRDQGRGPPAGETRRARGAGLLGGLRRPRLRRGAVHQRPGRRRPDPHPALRAGARAGRPARVPGDPRRDDHPARRRAGPRAAGRSAPRHPPRDAERLVPPRRVPVRRVRAAPVHAVAGPGRPRRFRSRAQAPGRAGDGARGHRVVAHVAAGPRDRPAAPGRRISPAGAGAVGLPESVPLHGGRAPRAGDGERVDRGARARQAHPGRGRGADDGGRARRRGAPASCCGRWPRT